MWPLTRLYSIRSRLVLGLVLALMIATAWHFGFAPRRFVWLANGIIVPPARAAEFYPGNDPSEPYWMPTLADVARLERGLPAHLQSQAGKGCCLQPGTPRRLDDYVRIYVGMYEHGRRVIVVQLNQRNNYEAVGDFEPARPWTQPLMVSDGGDSLMMTTWDVLDGTFHHFMTHGEA